MTEALVTVSFLIASKKAMVSNHRFFLLFDDVDIDLLIGDFDAFFVEGFFDKFHAVEVDVPVVGVLAPDTVGVVDGAGAHLL